MPCGVAGLADGKHLGGVLGDDDTHGGVLLVEQEPEQSAGVDEPEIEVGQTEALGVCAPQVADLVADGDVARRAVEEEPLAFSEGLVDEANPAECLALRGLLGDVAPPRVRLIVGDVRAGLP